MSNEIEKSKSTELTSAPATTPMQLIALAQSKNADVAQLKELFELQLRWEGNEAKKAYNDAVAAFKSETFSVTKNSEVGYKTKDGGFVGYKFATLAHIVDTVVPLLSRHGLTHSWETNQDNSFISVRCRLSHRDGHSEAIALSAPPDSSGKKNNIQAVGSTISYLQRYTLTSILGLAAGDQDDDGTEAERDNEKYLNENQIADLCALISELDVDEKAFLNYMGWGAIEDIPRVKFGIAVAALEKKRGK